MHSRDFIATPKMLYRAMRRQVHHTRNSRLSAEEVFSDIYRRNLWGGTPEDFCSGSGSSERVIAEYCALVGRLIKARGFGSVLDLGCGDYAVGARLSVHGAHYIGVDVVPGLVERNVKLYGSSRVSFVCQDITEGGFPEADLVLVRQVFQHLSNSQIEATLAAVPRGSTLLVTEHFPSPRRYRVANRDKVHGADTRVHYGSAVDLREAPFSLINAKVVLETPVSDGLVDSGEQIKTFLLEGQEQATP